LGGLFLVALFNFGSISYPSADCAYLMDILAVVDGTDWSDTFVGGRVGGLVDEVVRVMLNVQFPGRAR
jgi:hypothetical protein